MLKTGKKCKKLICEIVISKLNYVSPPITYAANVGISIFLLCPLILKDHPSILQSTHTLVI